MSGASCASNVTPEPQAHEAIGWKFIRADSGGRVDIPDGAWLDVPPGALPCDSMITVRVPRDAGEVRVYELEPSGMKFAIPVVLNVPYADKPDGSEPLMAAYHSSSANAVVHAGSEDTDWQPVDVAYRDEEKNVLGIALHHFTFVYSWVHIDDDAYVVLDLADKYLRPGDAVFSLTSFDDANKEPNWAPGHVGIVADCPDGARPVGHIIDSTPPKVRQTAVSTIKTEAGHLYMGARRPPDPKFTDLERSDCYAAAKSEVGDPYSLIGNGNLGLDSWSCVGIVEHVWDTIGRGVLGEFREVTAATPLELFRATRPVTEVWDRAKQKIEIPIYGVTIAKESPIAFRTLRGFYTRQGKYEIVATGKPDGSTFTGNSVDGYMFTWTPKIEDACVHVDGKPDDCFGGGASHLVTLEMTAYPEGLVSPWLGEKVIVNETLTLRVTGVTAVQDVVPDDGIGDAHEYLISLGVPPGAVIHEKIFTDEATGMYPSATPFPNHTLTVVSETCSETACSIRYALKNADTTPQTGTKKFRYYVDYSIPGYLGPPPPIQPKP